MSEVEKKYVVPKKPWMGEFTAKSDEEAVIKQIVYNSSYWQSNMCKRMTLIKYCVEKGIKNVEELLAKLEQQKIVYTPKLGYVGLLVDDTNAERGKNESRKP